MACFRWDVCWVVRITAASFSPGLRRQAKRKSRSSSFPPIGLWRSHDCRDGSGPAASHILTCFACWSGAGAELDGLPYLYVVMEYADQTLAQLLQHRALSDDEAREMLQPILDALAFLHGQDLVQGQLKPANILVVGDRLKLASDTIHRVNEGSGEPQRADCVRSSGSQAGWQFHRRGYLGSRCHPVRSVHSPSALCWASPGKVSRCQPIFRRISRRRGPLPEHRPEDRPSVSELLAWVDAPSAASVPAAPVEPTAAVPPGPSPPRTQPPPIAAAPRRRRAHSAKGAALETWSLAGRGARSPRDCRGGLVRN